MMKVAWCVVAALALAGCTTTSVPSAVTPSATEASASPSAEASPTPASPSPSAEASPTPSVSPTPQSTLGSISGQVAFPSEFLPAQLIYAIAVGGASKGAYATETVTSQQDYTIEGVAPGSYYVYAMRRPVQPVEGGVFAAGWSAFVPCGLSVGCPSHKPLAVVVRANAVTKGVDPIDWYAPVGTFPPSPSAVIPTDPATVAMAASYPKAPAAGVGVTQSMEAAWLVDDVSQCGANLACMTVGTEVVGNKAAYFVGTAGSNDNWLACGAYVYQTAAGWSGLRRSCHPGAVWPAVGASGVVSLGMGAQDQCANVRSTPAGSVVGCIKDGTLVKLDGGPTYMPMSGMDGLWWHVAGKGWMADDFLSS